VIPCRNAAPTLGRQLQALESQDIGEAFEVIVADNGSTDGSAEIARHWSERLPCLRVVTATPAGRNVARNAGIRAASGEVVAFCDADDEAHPSWLRELRDALEDGFDLVGGPLDWMRLNPQLPVRRQRLQAGLPNSLEFLSWAEGCNMAVRRAVLDKLGGFDESCPPQSGSDEVDFTWRAQLAGYRLGEAPRAVMHYAARPTSSGTFRQFVRYGHGHVRLYKAFARDGMPSPSAGSVAARWWWIVSRAPKALTPGEGREAFLRRSGISVGRILGSARYRTVYL
jgi:glycosyltransferase involved in cell wall biosynthesis